MQTSRGKSIAIAVVVALVVWILGGYLLWLGLLNYLTNQANEIGATDIDALNQKAMAYGRNAYIASGVVAYFVAQKLWPPKVG